MTLCKRTKVFISPHSDDIALSLGGYVLENTSASDWLVSVFTRSSYAPRASVQDVEAITDLRICEDRSFAASRGLKYQFCGLHERCAGISDVTSVVRQILSLHRRHPLFFVPLGLGSNPDHVALRKAFAGHVCTHDIAFYEELPYAWGFVSYKLTSPYATPVYEPRIYEFNRSTLCEKLAGMAIYRSQGLQRFAACVAAHGEQLTRKEGVYGERVWLPRGLAG